MQFNSLEFALFFPVVLAVYFLIPRKVRLYWLLAASYTFYMSWNAKYAFLIGGSTVITYVCALLLARLPKDSVGKRKGIVAVCLIVNLGILAVFKYGNFVIETMNRILGILHCSPVEQRFSFLLPVGISFYTFQALGYIIDVYRGEIDAEKNFFRYALFVSFFPQLVAGPIERSKNLLPQMREIESFDLWNAKRVTSGAILMVWGLFMKMVIADRVSILVDTVFDAYPMFGSTELIIAAMGFSLQIYCDFASYSMIAVGCARIMGFRLMENFNAPYFACGIRDFWSRWHISLSTWFRDYLYIPLGGNRKGKVRKAINTMIVFLVSGLWHGAQWKYVIWGGLHGAFQIAEDGITPWTEKGIRKLRVRTDCSSWHLLQSLITFIPVCFAWIFFRAASVTDAFRFIRQIFIRPTPWVLFDGGIYTLGLDQTEIHILLVSLLILFLVDLLRVKKGMMIDEYLFSQNLWFEWLVILVLILMIFSFGEYGPVFDAKQFIYFQF